MSTLSQKCRQYLEMTGHTIYTFARSTGLDVAMVHRMVNGTQLPSLDFFSVFCASLRINESERHELMELYEEETTGHAVYQNRRYIAHMISNLASGENPNVYAAPAPAASSDMKHKVQTHLRICSLLDEAFSQPGPSSEVFCNFPVNIPFPILDFMLHLYQKYAGRKKVKFHHLITFSSNPAIQTDSNCNLKILHQILPLVFSGFDEYLPCYYYSHASASDFYQIPWPYYLVTEHAVLLLSADGNNSILHRNPEQILWYRREMERLLQTAMPLISYSHSVEESLMLYHSYSWPAHPVFGYLTFQPCLMPCVTTEHLMKGFSSLRLPDGLIKRLPAPGSHFPSIQAPSYFSRDGLLNFWRTGKVTGQLAAYLPPFSPEERRNALLHFVSENNGNGEPSRMLKTGLQFPPNLYIELLQNHRLLICMFEKGDNLRFLFFGESSVYDAFTDFFQYLGMEKNSCSAAETNQFILKLLENPQTGGENHVKIQ